MNMRVNRPENEPQQLLAVDLFAGGGGLTIGLKSAGFHVVGAVEIDDLAVETYEANHKDVKLWHGDIRELDVDEVRRKLHLRLGQLDVLAACPPCQGFSSLTTKNGSKIVNDPRNSLVWEFVRFVEGLRPKAIMLENVPGLARESAFEKVRSELERLGYTVDYRIRNSARFGVPQRRRRLILLGGRYGQVPFPGEEGADPITVRDAIGDLPVPGYSGDPLHDISERRSPRVQRIIGMVPLDGGSRSELPEDMILPCHRRGTGFKDVYGRMAWDSVAPTITSGCVNPSKGRFLHPSQSRAITLREAALLQGFPADYWFSLRKGKYAVAAMIGNALPPEFIRRHAVNVYAYVRSRRVRKTRQLLPQSSAPGSAKENDIV